MKRIRSKGGQSGRRAEENIPSELMEEIRSILSAIQPTEESALRDAARLTQLYTQANITTQEAYIAPSKVDPTQYRVRTRSSMEHFDSALLIHQLEAPFA